MSKAQEVAEWLMKRGVSFEVRATCVLHARYHERTEVHSPWDVVRDSKDWHDFSADRFDGWAAPAYPWGELYAELEAQP